MSKIIFLLFSLLFLSTCVAVFNKPTQESNTQATKEEVVPTGWTKTDKEGVYWKWCDDNECDKSKVIGDNGYVLLKVWCKNVSCGDIYGQVNLLKNDVVVGWTNDTGYGDIGQVVQLTFSTFQDFQTARLTELTFR